MRKFNYIYMLYTSYINNFYNGLATTAPGPVAKTAPSLVTVVPILILYETGNYFYNVYIYTNSYV